MNTHPLNSALIYDRLKAAYRLPSLSRAQGTAGDAVCDGEHPWDHVNLNGLYCLQSGNRHDNHNYGYALRPYWSSPERFVYRCVTQSTTEKSDLQMVRSMVRSQAHTYVWREDINGTRHSRGVVSPVMSSNLRWYCQTDHTLRTQPFGTSDPPVPKSVDAARESAIAGLPFLFSPQALRVGSCWYGRSGSSSIVYSLAGEAQVGGITVLFIRRAGETTLRFGGPSQTSKSISLSLFVQGVSSYAVDANILLEDRAICHLAGTENIDPSTAEGVDGMRTITRLMEVLPPRDDLAQSSAPAATMHGKP